LSKLASPRVWRRNVCGVAIGQEIKGTSGRCRKEGFRLEQGIQVSKRAQKKPTLDFVSKNIKFI